MYKAIKKGIYRKFRINLTVLLLAVFAVVTCSYLYFVNNTVAGIIGKDSGKKESRELALECQKLEKEYLTLTSNIDLNYAISKGFIEKKNISFVAREKNYALNQKSTEAY